MYIDSHCHLNHNRLLNIGEPAQIIQNAKNDGHVDAMLTICCRIHKEFEDIKAIAESNDNVWFTVGTHPHDASDDNEKQYTTNQIVEMANSHPKIVGIGETGLDYFYKNASHEDQHKNFRKHIRACLETDMPIIIHARDADEDMIRIIEEESPDKKLRGVMHCFSSSRALGEWALNYGLYISFSGIVTFKNAQDLRDFAIDVPMDKMLIETDSPFLAPEPERGQINQPSLMHNTGKLLASLKEINEEELARATKDNFFTLFNRAKSCV